MKTLERREGDVLIVELSGRMTISSGDAARAGRAIRRALESGEKRIVVDMSDVPVVDSAGLGELISAYVWARRSNAAMKLLKLSARVREVMRVTRVTGVFDTFDAEPEAIASFG